MQIILYAIPGFILLILLEWLYGLARGRNTYSTADTSSIWNPKPSPAQNNLIVRGDYYI